MEFLVEIEVKREENLKLLTTLKETLKSNRWWIVEIKKKKNKEENLKTTELLRVSEGQTEKLDSEIVTKIQNFTDSILHKCLLITELFLWIPKNYKANAVSLF